MAEGVWERTLVLLKPDAAQRALMGVLISRFERVGLTIRAMKLLNASVSLAENLYEIHREKSYFKPLVELLTSGPVLAMALEGADVISVVRKIVGATEPRIAEPGSIRGDFCHMGYARSKTRMGVIPNLIHASDSPETAKQELALCFGKDDYVSPYKRLDAHFM